MLFFEWVGIDTVEDFLYLSECEVSESGGNLRHRCLSLCLAREELTLPHYGNLYLPNIVKCVNLDRHNLYSYGGWNLWIRVIVDQINHTRFEVFGIFDGIGNPQLG